MRCARLIHEDAGYVHREKTFINFRMRGVVCLLSFEDDQ